VALRAYDVGHEERASILRYVFKQMESSPLQFLFPVQPKPMAAEGSAEDIERPAPAA
jgi:site-specific recombinase